MPTGEQLIQDLLHPFREAMTEQKITPRLLVRKLKAELSANVTKTLKVKGATGKLPRGFRNVVTTGDYCNGESVLMWLEVAWDVRQRARIDAQRLLNLYPPERRELSGPGGAPLQVGSSLEDTERAARLIFLLDQADKRAKEAQCKQPG